MAKRKKKDVRLKMDIRGLIYLLLHFLPTDEIYIRDNGIFKKDGTPIIIERRSGNDSSNPSNT